MNKPHKFAEVINAWAEGKEIEFKHKADDVWRLFVFKMTPNFNAVDLEWRIKSKPSTIRYMTGLFYDPTNQQHHVISLMISDNIMLSNYIKTTGFTFIKFLQNWKIIEV